MLYLVGFLCAAYVVVVAVRRVTRAVRRADSALVELLGLPDEDQPPATAVGWPPDGARYTPYVDEGFAALDAYLSEGSAT